MPSISQPETLSRNERGRVGALKSEHIIDPSNKEKRIEDNDD